MIIEFNSCTDKTNISNDFNLYNIVKKEAFSMDKEKNPSKINELVLDCQKNYTNEKFEYLLKIIFRTYDIFPKITETTAGSNQNYLSEDDYFQLYSQILWTCIMKYNPNKYGDFKNFFIMFFRVNFLEQKKSSFMKVTGNIKKSKRKERRFVCYENDDRSLGKESKELISVENRDVIERILSCLDDEEKKLIVTIFFSTENGKTRNPEEVTAMLNISKNHFFYVRRRAFEKIKTYYPKAMDDFYYKSENNIIEFVTPNNEIDITASNELKAA